MHRPQFGRSRTSMLVTCDVSNDATGWLKLRAPRNMYCAAMREGAWITHADGQSCALEGQAQPARARRAATMRGGAEHGRGCQECVVCGGRSRTSMLVTFDVSNDATGWLKLLAP